MFNNHGNNHSEIALNHGNLHIFANEEVFNSIETKTYEMADNNLRIPRNLHMSYTPDVHVGVGTCIGTTAVWQFDTGFISPSIVGSDIGCGMRLHKTNLHKDDLKDKALKRKLIEAIEKYVPTGERAEGYWSDELDLRRVVTEGIEAVGSVDGTYVTGMTHRVEHSVFNMHDPDYWLPKVPAKAWHYASKQIGTIGSGNHFIEIQYVEVEDAETAAKWGLFDGQVVFMLHSGSRAWGGMMGNMFTKVFKAEMEKWGVSNPDPNLVYAPLNSEVGLMYYNLMLSALNFAVVNRHMMAVGIGHAFNEVMGKDVQIEVVYDLMHNYALREPHRNKPMMVHRKGATRALPAGHFLNPKEYKETGHPALIPGSMGTASFIMKGREEGIKNFYSICHGAGRLRSRRATRELVTVDQFASSLRVGEEDEILVNHRTLESILDECPQAYKDIDLIIDSVVGAKLADVVARCKPMIGIKGV